MIKVSYESESQKLILKLYIRLLLYVNSKKLKLKPPNR